MCTWRLCCYICQKHFIMLMSYFFFFLLMHYTAFLMAIKCGSCLQGNLLIRDFFCFKQNIKGDKTTSIFRINTGKTLCKLHWNSKIPLQRNVMLPFQKSIFFIDGKNVKLNTVIFIKNKTFPIRQIWAHPFLHFTRFWKKISPSSVNSISPV